MVHQDVQRYDLVFCGRANMFPICSVEHHMDLLLISDDGLRHVVRFNCKNKYFKAFVGVGMGVRHL